MAPVADIQEKSWRIPERFGDEPTGETDLPEPTDLPACLSVDELRDGFKRRFDELKALDIDYIFNSHGFTGNERLVPFGQHHFAFSADRRFKSQSGGGCFYPSTYPAQADGSHFFPYINPQTIWVWNGELQRTFHANSKDANVDEKKDSWTEWDPYLRGAGIPVESVEAERSTGKTSLFGLSWAHKLIDRNQRWEVQPKLDVFDGAACHVLKSKSPPVKRLWIDPTINFGVRFNEALRRPRFSLLGLRRVPPNEWPVLGRVAFRDYRLMAGHTWLPWRMEANYYVSCTSDALFRELEYACVWQVQKLAVNEEVLNSIFSLDFPPGTVVFDQARKCTYHLGENHEETRRMDWEE